MSEDQIYITPLDIRDYLYCPYILYLKRIRGIEEPETELMKIGRELYEEEKRRSGRRKTLLGLRKIPIDEIWYDVNLYSRKYRIYGVADAVYRVGSRYGVLEIKYGEYRKGSTDHFYQAVSYAVMYEEEYGRRIYYITLYYSNGDKLISRRFTNMHREHWKNIVERIWRIIEGKDIPTPSDDLKKCSVCFYRGFCLGRI